MKRRMMDILACPICKGELALQIDEEEGDEIVTGSLYCPRCRRQYHIVDRIPDLLPQEPDSEQQESQAT
ncbi:MAG: methytransferase partner Trm112 [Chloroflexota bacterium]